MVTKVSLSTVLVASAIVYGGIAWFLGIQLTWTHLTPFGAVLTVVTLLGTLFERILWSLWPITVFAKTPDLRGTWALTLQSTYVDPTTGKQKESINGTATIRQTYSTLSIRTVTPSQTSFLIAHHIIRHADNVYEVTGVYQSDPGIELRGEESEIHYGAFRYRLDEEAITLTGHYWTDRNTRGRISLRRNPPKRWWERSCA